MAESKLDNNGIQTMIGVLNTDGVTPTRVTADPTSHALDISDNTTGSDLGNDIVARDNSGQTTMAATDDNGSIINLYVDSSGNLLIDST